VTGQVRSVDRLKVFDQFSMVDGVRLGVGDGEEAFEQFTDD
jgi:hypothetical protein